MTLRAAFLEHSEWDRPGLVGERVRDLAWSISRHRADRGADGLPVVGSFDLLVVMGSAASAMDDGIEWIRAERRLVARAVADGIPVFGICFGAQLLAQVLGGSVTRASSPEIGWLTVETTDPDAVPVGPWVVWHEDAITAPPGARLLASSAVSLHAFSHGVHTGVQFHPEATPEIVSHWIADALLTGEVTAEQAAALRLGFAVAGSAAEDRTRQLVDRVIERAGMSP